MIGNEEDFSAALGFDVEGVDEHIANVEAEAFKKMICVSDEGVSVSGSGNNTAPGHNGHTKRLGRNLLG